MHHDLNLLAVSVGNTRTRLGAFVHGQLEHAATFENAQNQSLQDAISQAFAVLKTFSDATVLLSSVSQPAEELVTKALKAQLQQPIVRVERDITIPIGRQLDREAMVGEDRLLNAAAAFDVLKQACVVVDAGTAITVDFIDGAGTFHGGAIAPGVKLQLDSLHERTALLPEIEFAKPTEPIGHNTADAMRCGVYYGVRGLLHQAVERFAEVAGHFPLVVATGGDADTLFRDDELVDRVVPDLTLTGLAVTLRRTLEEA